MRILRLVVISSVVFFSLFWIASLFIPSQITISKAINIAAPSRRIATEIKDIHNWGHWYPGIENAPPQPILSQDSCFVMGNAHVAICFNVRTDSFVQATMSMPGKTPVITGWKIMPFKDSTAVQWYSRISLHWYPWEKFSSLFFEKTQGYTMEKGLSQLKSYVQSSEEK